MKKATELELEYNIDGEDCYILVTNLVIVPPSTNPYTAPSADDYYGYMEFDWEVYDLDGNEREDLREEVNETDIEAMIKESVEDYNPYE